MQRDEISFETQLRVLDPSRSVWRGCILAVLVIALLLVISQLLIQLAINGQQYDGHVINVAGRQRMLSQRITKAALAVYEDELPVDRQKHLAELEMALLDWRQAHRALQQGDDSMNLPSTRNSEIVEAFGQIDLEFNTMSEAADRFLDIYANVSFDKALNPRQRVAAHHHINTILDHEADFLKGMHRIVGLYDEQLAAKASFLSFIGTLTFLVTIAVLLIEVIFVFRPAVRMIRTQFRKLEESRIDALRSVDSPRRTGSDATASGRSQEAA